MDDKKTDNDRELIKEVRELLDVAKSLEAQGAEFAEAWERLFGSRGERDILDELIDSVDPHSPKN